MAEGQAREQQPSSWPAGRSLNVILDALFILVFGWGITGAASATVTRARRLAVLYVAFGSTFPGGARLSITLDALIGLAWG